MNLNEQLMDYKKEIQIEPQEEKIVETIRISKELYLSLEQENYLSYYDFLWTQLKVVEKKWWVLQLLLLFMLGKIVSVYKDGYWGGGMGVMASIFVILVIPEFWRNRSYHCVEIEETSYYSLKKIYSARMVLFGIVDTLLLTVFCGIMTMRLHIEFTNLLVQFFLPMFVTACICFGTLCSKYIMNESVAIILCVLWCAMWLIITLNEKIYIMVTLPVWLICIGISLIFLCISIWRILNECTNYWEVDFDGTGAE